MREICQKYTLFDDDDCHYINIGQGLNVNKLWGNSWGDNSENITNCKIESFNGTEVKHIFRTLKSNFIKQGIRVLPTYLENISDSKYINCY